MGVLVFLGIEIINNIDGGVLGYFTKLWTDVIFFTKLLLYFIPILYHITIITYNDLGLVRNVACMLGGESTVDLITYMITLWQKIWCLCTGSRES